jgi:carbonic anhydrase
MVMKQPVEISAEQLRLFAQLFPMNARPLQAVNARPVREGK